MSKISSQRVLKIHLFEFWFKLKVMGMKCLSIVEHYFLTCLFYYSFYLFIVYTFHFPVLFCCQLIAWRNLLNVRPTAVVYSATLLV